MAQALAQAKIAYDIGEIPVGCLIVNNKNGEIIVATHNLMQRDKNPNYHAEILAINAACNKLSSKNLNGCDIYVTLEPCTMCASAIANARIARVYYAAEDKKHGAVENGVRFFTTNSCFHRPEIYSGINEAESSALLKTFFSKIRKDEL